MTEGGRQKIVWGKPGGEDRPSEVAAGPSEGGSGGSGGRRFLRPTKHVFITGMDLFTTEEIKKREKRAERFSTDLGITYKAVEKSEYEEKKKKRAERFGMEYKEPDLSGMMEVDLLEKRKDADGSSSSRLDTVHVYGVDLLSTKDIMKYFSEYFPQYVEWINDSSCNVVFADAGTAKRVLASLGKPLAEANEDDTNSVDQLFKSMGKTWHKGTDFLKNGKTPVPIMFRLATDEDVKPRERGVSRYLWRGRDAGRRQHRKRRAEDGDVVMRDVKKRLGPEDDGREVVSYGDL
ncbi:nuclear cap-binding protein subunit 3 [Chloropicon primus]|uniref:Nuclear cap-binding protein subunit 3 n=1 Tax=Chloropicon primus TaxID=1764295 RepID=A0A5B8MI42_9CHLO|nr:nuclear cap-binding protein subunit 3 [Chloropicon primus]UPQ99172.1 nuclear cap-binding protein subunit 3 [Chloropicon primus]|mmetsp:Transcript_5529/g.16775  ORF Transcript_5529/g.16775 Transcript_5529/m.16775 type:complete len:291 (+) Transcript_5529:377-1249(+)|eukprot:QDZ19961.1 nuclear cap-binding protein subunit 3 [Chloropicon primus]